MNESGFRWGLFAPFDVLLPFLILCFLFDMLAVALNVTYDLLVIILYETPLVVLSVEVLKRTNFNPMKELLRSASHQSLLNVLLMIVLS